MARSALAAASAEAGRPGRHLARLLGATALAGGLAGPTAADTWMDQLDNLDQGAPARIDLVAYQISQAEAEIAFDIPPQALSAALAAFGSQSGYQVSVDHSTLAGLDSAGVSGSYTPEEALRRLLAGTGVTWRFADARSVVLEKLETDGATLDPVTAEGQAYRESASGPVDGYVATQSATATKTGTPLIETPQSISVITADRVEAQGAESLAQVLRYTPGANGEVFGLDTRGYGLQLRGFGDNSDTALYRDGLQLRGASFASFLTLDPYGAERIEVLRGPASVLYGQNDPGGIINFVTKRPSATPSYEIGVGAGSFDHYEGRFDLGGPIDEEGSLLYRVTGIGFDSDTQVNYVSHDRVYIAPALTWQPDDDTTVTFLSHYQHDDSGWAIQFLPSAGTVESNPNGTIPLGTFVGEPGFDDYVLTQYSAGYQLEHRAGDVWTLRQNARYSHLDNEQRGVFGNGLQADQVTLDRYGDAGESMLDGYTVDNQAQAELVTGPLAHTLLVGLDYQHYRFNDFGASYLVDPINVYDPGYGSAITFDGAYQDAHVTLEQFGLYLQDQIKLDDKWSLLLGGRHDWADTKTRDNLFDTHVEQRDSAFTGRAGLVYLSETGLAPYVSYAESFVPILATDVNGRPFDPETGRQYEIGVKYQPPGMNSFVTVAAFDLVRQNALTTDPLDPTNQVQSAERRSRGIEVEGVASLDSGLELIAAYTYLSTEITEDNDGNTGNTPYGVPVHKASLWADYTIQSGDFAGLGFAAGVRYVGRTWGDDANTFRVPDYVLADAAVHYEWNDFRFALNADNILDNDHIASCFAAFGCFYGEGRKVLGTVTFSW
jgi:iron complex outermembrane receptor protein